MVGNEGGKIKLDSHLKSILTIYSQVAPIPLDSEIPIRLSLNKQQLFSDSQPCSRLRSRILPESETLYLSINKIENELQVFGNWYPSIIHGLDFTIHNDDISNTPNTYPSYQSMDTTSSTINTNNTNNTNNTHNTKEEKTRCCDPLILVYQKLRNKNYQSI